ncbi:hypothetical protein PG990_001733 [Apiospora arundinis]
MVLLMDAVAVGLVVASMACRPRSAAEWTEVDSQGPRNDDDVQWSHGGWNHVHSAGDHPY